MSSVANGSGVVPAEFWAQLGPQGIQLGHIAEHMADRVADRQAYNQAFVECVTWKEKINLIAQTTLVDKTLMAKTMPTMLVDKTIDMIEAVEVDYVDSSCLLRLLVVKEEQ